METTAEKAPEGPKRISSVYTVLVSALALVPYLNHAACGAASVRTPLYEADRVAPVTLTSVEETAVMFPPPEVPPPDPFHSIVTTIFVNLNDPVMVKTTEETPAPFVQILSVSDTSPELAAIFPFAHVVVP